MSWSCVAGELTTVDAKTKEVTTRRVASDSTSRTAASLAVGDDYDTWCENASRCTREISDYISETKGNAAYGNQNGTIGNFDVILRTNLNGRSARWNVTLDWDNGPTMRFSEAWVNCFEDRDNWPDLNCGNHRVARASDGATTFTVPPPMRSKQIQGNRLNHSNTYYGQTNGRFRASGMGFVMGTLKSAEFHCWGSDPCYFP